MFTCIHSVVKKRLRNFLAVYQQIQDASDIILQRHNRKHLFCLTNGTWQDCMTPRRVLCSAERVHLCRAIQKTLSPGGAEQAPGRSLRAVAILTMGFSQCCGQRTQEFLPLKFYRFLMRSNTEELLHRTHTNMYTHFSIYTVSIMVILYTHTV